MKRATAIKHSDAWNPSEAVDRIVLDADQRHRRRMVLTGEGGTVFLLDLPRAVMLKDGDGLVLDDASIVRVVGRPESLIEVSATPQELARLAWHIGNRHTDMQMVDGKLRIRRDPVLEAMLLGLGAKLTPLKAPFNPEPGAYAHDGDNHAF